MTIPAALTATLPDAAAGSAATAPTAPEPHQLRRPAFWATVGVVLALVGLNVADHVLGWNTMWLGPVGALGLLAFARATGLSWEQLGLARHTHAAGVRWGLGVIGVVGVIYLAGVLIPDTRTAFLDVRYHLPPTGALLTAFVIIPVGTILLEEVAFRSVLWGFLARHLQMWKVVAGSSLLFGLWHVLPAIGSAGNAAVGAAVSGLGAFAHIAIIAGTVVFTAAGGVVAGELRRRSGSLWASVGMHWATNALGVLFGVLAWRLAA